MKHQAVFRVLLVLGILANIGVLGFLATEKPVPFAVEAWEPFQAQGEMFSVKYPRGWKSNEITGAIDIEARFTTENDVRLTAMAAMKGALFTDLITFNPTSGDPPLKQCHEMLVDRLRARYPGFTTSSMSARHRHGHKHNLYKVTPANEVSATVPIKVGTLDALSTTFDYKIMDGLKIRSMKGAVVSIWNGESHLALCLNCPADEFEDMLPMFSTFMQTFKCKIAKPEKIGDHIRIPMPF